MTPAERARRYRDRKRGGPPRQKREGPRVQYSPAQRHMLAALANHTETDPYTTDDGQQQRTLRALAAKNRVHLKQDDDHYTYHAWPKTETQT